MRGLRSATVAGVALLLCALVAVGPAVAKGAGGFGGSGAAPGTSSIAGPPGTEASGLRYAAVSGGTTTSVLAIETDGGAIRDQRQLRHRWALPAVTSRGEPGGLSADGETLVLLRPRHLHAGVTTFRVLAARNLRTRDEVTLNGRFAFDAISPEGQLMYLIQYQPNLFEYRVRVYDLSAGELRRGAIVDPDEAGDPMTGEPVSRAMSPDGRWAYTVYRGNETFVHALDTENATAVCIDLPQFEDVSFYGLDLSVEPASGAITVLEKGDPAALIDPETFEVSPANEARVADAGGGTDWLVWALIGGGVALCAGVVVVQRRWRRRPAPVDAGLKDALRSEPAEREREEERPREPVA
jgi:hypothetical protein